MAPESKKQAISAAPKKTGSDRRRLVYLKTRIQEVREEIEALKTEMTELRKKHGTPAKSGGAKGKKADDDDEED